jgi:hypothetical protein
MGVLFTFEVEDVAQVAFSEFQLLLGLLLLLLLLLVILQVNCEEVLVLGAIVAFDVLLFDFLFVK